MIYSAKARDVKKASKFAVLASVLQHANSYRPVPTGVYAKESGQSKEFREESIISSMGLYLLALSA